jgi:RHS repeat-associated protein
MTRTIRSNGYLYAFTAAGPAPSGAQSFARIDDARQLLEALAGHGQAQQQLEQLHAEQGGGGSVGQSWSEKLAELAAMLADGRLAVVKTPLPKNKDTHRGGSGPSQASSEDPYNRWADGSRPLDREMPAQGFAYNSSPSGKPANKKEHYLDLHYAYDDGEPVANAPFRVTYADGHVEKGNLDASGRYFKIIPDHRHGPVQVVYEDQPAIDEQIRAAREQLQAYLDGMVQEAADNSRQVESKLSEYGLLRKGFFYTGKLFEGLAGAAWDTVKGGWDLFIGYHRLKARIGVELAAAFTSGGVDGVYTQLCHYAHTGERAVDELQQAFENITVIMGDPACRQMLADFPERYFDNMHLSVKLEMLGAASLDLVIALATMGGGAAASALSKSRYFKKAAAAFGKIVALLKRARLVKKAAGKTDKTLASVVKKLTHKKIKPKPLALDEPGTGLEKAVAKTRKANARKMDELAGTAKGEPVNCITGEVLVDQTDFTLPGRLPLTWTRSYGSAQSFQGVCGPGWQTPADARLEQDGDGIITFDDGAGAQAVFEHLPQIGPVTETAGGAVLDLDAGQLRVTLKNGLAYRFDNPTQFESCPVRSVHNRTGQSLRFERDRHGLCAIGFDDGRTLDVQSKKGRITRLSFKDRVLIEYHYNEHGRLTQVRDPFDNPYTFAYENGRLSSHSDRTGLTFYYTYDEQGRCTRTWGDNGLYAYSFAYEHLRTTITNSLGHRETYDYDDTLLPLRIKNALGHVTVFEYDTFGRPAAVIDPLGRRTEYSRNAQGDLICVTRPDKSAIGWTYDHNHNPVERIDPAGRRHQSRFDQNNHLVAAISPTGAITHYNYNPSGDLVSVTDPCGSTTRIDYDPLGQPVAVTDPLNRRTCFDYDPLGNVTARIDPAGRITAFDYDPKSRLIKITKPSGATLSYAYDPSDRLTALTDELGHTTRIDYFGIDKVAKRTYPDGASVSYRYDSEEQLTGLTDQNGRSFTLKRDPVGQILSQTDYWGALTRFAHDKAGRLVRRTDPMGAATTFVYDLLDRLVEKQYDDGAKERFAYDALGNLTAHENDFIAVRRVFDRENRLIKEIQGDQAIVFAYDRNGRRTRRRSPHGNRIGYAYDAAGQLKTVTVNQDTTISLEHDELGRPVSETLSNHITRSYAYDQDDRLTGLKLNLGERPGFERTFAYDLAGNLTRRSDPRGNERFDYDPLGRVIRHLNPEDRLKTYDYDPAGDLPREAPVRAASKALYRSTRLNGQHYSFDKNGRRVQRRSAPGEIITYSWDKAGRLAAVKKPQFGGIRMAYDALGRRVCKDGLGAENDYLWDGDVLLSDQRNHKNAREYVFYPNTFIPLAVIDAARQIHYYHNDPNGAPTEVTDATGKIVWAARYSPTGDIDTLFVNKFDNPIRLQGQYEDRETGLHYNRHRYYAPVTGQFLSQDPLGLAAGENLYSFAPNAFGWIDPLGLTCKNASKKTGWLKHHDDWGGHALGRHVGKTDAELISRLQSSRRIRGASTFTDQATAENVISSTISGSRNQVKSWLRSAQPGERLRLNYSGTDSIGKGIMRGQATVNDMSNARIILQSSGNGKYHVLTAFPE